MKIPVCTPNIGEKELEYVTDCVKSGWISSMGKYVKEFEEGFAEWCGCKYGIACTSGTTALHLATVALGIGDKDEVIVPTHTMIASSNSVIYAGGTPVLVDSEPYTWNMDVTKIEEKITSRTKAIMPVHTYGHPCLMDEILNIADDYDLYIIEDAAEAHGAEYKGRRVGSIGNVGCFSFYANKIICTGEGGCLVTNDEKIANRARNLRDHAFSSEKHFWHKRLGFNYRITNMQGAIGCAQLERIDGFIETKRRNAALYSSLLKDVSGLTLPPEAPLAKNVYWMYGLLVDEDKFGMNRDELQKRLEDKGIETRTFFIPLHYQPCYRKMGLFKDEQYPIADVLARDGMYLPSSTKLSEEEIKYVCNTIKEERRNLYH